MTPQDVQEYARQQYNSVSDNFFGETELYRHLWAAQMELAREAWAIERVYTTSTVVDQQEYSFPTLTIAIKRVTYDGQKLMPITFREDDSLTLSNQTTVATGTPLYYAVWNRVLYLRPIPAAVGTVKILSYNEPQEVSSTSVLEVDPVHHLNLADYLLWKKAAKDKNFQAAAEYRDTWKDYVKRARAYQRRSKRGDSFTSVQDFEMLPVTVIGAV